MAGLHRHDTPLPILPHHQLLRLTPKKAYTITSLDSLYYTDEDISAVVEAILQQPSSPIGYAENHTYRLIKKGNESRFIHDEEDGKDYIVALTPALDTSGKNYKESFSNDLEVSSLNIDYHLDKGTRLKGVVEEVLEKLLQSMSEIKASTNPYDQLLFEVANVKEGSASEMIATILHEEHENVENIFARVQRELNILKESHKDVFDEIMPLVLASDSSHAKILFPYNLTCAHWLTGEIRIHKAGEQYRVEIFAHDPMGGGEIDVPNFNRLQETIKKRIREFHKTAQFLSFERTRSSYDRRQAPGDFISCGVIVADDILKRISGPLTSSYAAGAKKLRRAHVELAQRDNNSHIPFVERNKAKIDRVASLKFLKAPHT